MSTTKIDIYNIYNVSHDGNKVDIAAWAEKFNMKVNVEDEERKQRLYLGNDVVAAISRGYGAGWSTWNMFTAVDPVMNLMILTLKDMVNNGSVIDGESVRELYGALREDFPQYSEYLGGTNSVSDIDIEYVDKNVRFRVTEYDGNEEIQYQSEIEWL